VWATQFPWVKILRGEIREVHWVKCNSQVRDFVQL
jgi:hypothetical protein